MPNSTVVVSSTTPNGPLVEKNGFATRAFLKWMQGVGTTVNGAFDSQGNYQGPIGSQATIAGRATLASIVQFVTTGGIVLPAGLTAATAAAQGAVIMPAGAVDNQLGTASIQPSTAFDPAGAAAAAQSAAETFAAAQAAAAQSNAQIFASNATNLTSGTVNPALLPGIGVTITTAALTALGSQGSMTFTNGLLTSQVQAT